MSSDQMVPVDARQTCDEVNQFFESETSETFCMSLVQLEPPLVIHYLPSHATTAEMSCCGAENEKSGSFVALTVR